MMKIRTPKLTTSQRVIYKYKITPGGQTIVSAHWEDILNVQAQDDEIVVWASIAPYEKDVLGNTHSRRDEPKQLAFWAIGTGCSYDKRIGEYLGTAQTSDGLVWHIFVSEEIVPDD